MTKYFSYYMTWYQKGSELMKITHTLGGSDNTVHGRNFPKDSIIMQLDNGLELVCCDFHHSRENPLELFCYILAEKKWIKTYAKNEYTEMMWDYYRKISRKNKTRGKKHRKSSIKKSKGTRVRKIPNSVSWAAAHPYQGGGVSPR